MGEMVILSSKGNKGLILDRYLKDWREGDVKVMWNSKVKDEVEAAEEQFNTLIKKGYLAFEVGAKGQKTSRQVTEFDPDLGKLIMVHPAGGG